VRGEGSFYTSRGKERGLDQSQVSKLELNRVNPKRGAPLLGFRTWDEERVRWTQLMDRMFIHPRRAHLGF
jgi:hypothetical protein